MRSRMRLGARLACGVAATLTLAVGSLVMAPAAGAAGIPTLSRTVQTTLCATPTGKYCGQTLTAEIAAGTPVTVVCSHGPAYYIQVTARQNQEGYVARTDVSDPPSGLTDCDSASHQAIWAAALAIGYLGTDTDPEYCLTFVIDMWRKTGAGIASANEYPPAWWSSSANIWPKQTSKTNPGRWLTPPRGALVFWGAKGASPGHVAISVGNGWLVSTAEGSTPGQDVHLLQISHRNADGFASVYLGWVKP